jgi:hypothetical protein
MRMNWPPLLTALTLIPLGSIMVRSAESTYPAGVEVKDYAGWKNAIHLANGEVLAVAVPGAGGRLLRYQLHGENILYYDPALAGKTLADLNGRGAHGGHQIDIGPELRGMPKHDDLWWGEYAWHIPGPYSARLTSKPDPGAGVQITKEFVLDSDNGDLGVTQTIRNSSTATVKYCLWDRTLCPGDGFAIIPLNRNSRFANKWALRVKDAGDKWLYDGNAKAPREVKVIKNHLVVKCNGPATKVGTDSAEGWIAYVRGKLLYVKYFPYYSGGEYTDGGCSAEIYFNERFAELEPLSPEVELNPGDSFEFPEKWVLIELDEMVNTAEQAQKAVRKIPPSPFK